MNQQRFFIRNLRLQRQCFSSSDSLCIISLKNTIFGDLIDFPLKKHAQTYS